MALLFAGSIPVGHPMEKANNSLEPIPDYGLHMPIEEFIKDVRAGNYNEYDGSAYYATATKMSDICVMDMSRIGNTEFTHIVWFNK